MFYALAPDRHSDPNTSFLVLRCNLSLENPLRIRGFTYWKGFLFRLLCLLQSSSEGNVRVENDEVFINIVGTNRIISRNEKSIFLEQNLLLQILLLPLLFLPELLPHLFLLFGQSCSYWLTNAYALLLGDLLRVLQGVLAPHAELIRFAHP